MSSFLPHNASTHRTQGFTLAEMSVVITVIAIMLGQNMIRSSRLQATIGRVAEYGGAVVKFRDRFFALPGDMTNATSLWGQASSAGACIGPFGSDTAGDALATAGTGTQTCNGDGDGVIGNEDTGCGVRSWEYFRAWKHLANAELVSEATRLTGYAGTSSKYHAIPGTNVPKTPIEGGGYTLRGCGNVSGAADGYFNGFYGHVLQVGSNTTTAGTVGDMTTAPLFYPSEALEIDKKIDDSYPNTGTVMATRQTTGSSPNCTTSAVTTPGFGLADYDIAQGSVPRCSLFFKLGF